MFAIFEMLGLCGILGIKTLSDKHKIRQTNKEYARHRYNYELERKIRRHIQSTRTKPDGTPLDLNAQNLVSYDYITIQELRKRGFEPTPYFTTINLSAFKFDEETGVLIREPTKPF